MINNRPYLGADLTFFQRLGDRCIQNIENTEHILYNKKKMETEYSHSVSEYTVLKFLDDHNDVEWRNKIGDLLKYFCNNVFLGQWELARCAALILNDESSEINQIIVEPAASPQNDDLGKRERNMIMNTKIFTNMLIDVTQYPFSQSLGSRTVPSPHHLSWLCLQALNKGRSLKLSDQLSKEVDFRLTLSSLQVDDLSVCQELYTCFKKSLHQASSDCLNAKCSEVLKQTLQQSPALGDSLIRSLMGSSQSGPSASNPSLQALYLESVAGLLDTDGEKLVEILSYYNPEPYLNYLQLRQLLACVVTTALNQTLPGVTVQTLMSAMTGRSTFYLLEEFSHIFQEVSVVSQGNDELELKTEHIFSWLSMSGVDRDKAWRDHFTFCSRKRVHFITDLLDLSLALVKGGNLPELQELLSYPELQPLKCVVLLMGWSHCLTSTQAQSLLDTLWDDTVDSYNQALGNSCRKLSQHLDLIHWCMDRAKPILPGVGAGAPVYGSQLLQGLETHSVLHVLHHSASLTSLDHTEVLQLLTNISAEKRNEKKKKSVQFEDEQAVLSRVDVDQLKDVSTFRGYCAVKNVLDAAWFCGQQGDKLMNPVTIRHYSGHLDRAFQRQLSSSEGEDSCSPGGERHGSTTSPGVDGGGEFVQSYDLKVSRKLREAKEMLSLLQPLSYRVEILENIFSILFISYEDLVDEALDVELEEVVPADCTNTCSEEDTGTRQTRATAALSYIQHPTPSTSSARPFSLDYDVPFVDPSCGATPHMSPAHIATPHSAVSPTPQQDVSPKSCKKKKRSPSTGPALTGFVLNEYLVRDILHLLKDAISDLKSARVLLTSTKKTGLDPAAEALLNKSQCCSVQPEDLAKRLSRLTQAVHEAWWRFQLVSHEAIPRQAFHLLTERIYISDQELHVLPVCESRPTHSGSDRQGTALASNIVEKMISSPQSLLVLTLMKGSPTQAAQVMKLFHVTEKSAETCELSFGEDFHTCAKKIWNLESEAREKAHVGVGKRSMKALSKAASVGVATATLSNLVEELLARPSLPPVPQPRRSSQVLGGASHLLDVVSVQLLELLCCWSRSWESCSNMLDMCKAKTQLLDTDPRRPPSDQLTSPTPSVGVKGCLEFVWSLYELIHCTDAGQDIQQLLHSALSTFSARGLRDFSIASLETRRSVERIQAILSCQHHLDIPDHETAASPRGSASSLSGSDSSRSRCSVEVKLGTEKNQLHAAIKQLMYTMEKFVPAVGLTQLLHNNKSPPTFKNYLLSLYKHAKEMTNLLAESEGLSQEASSNYFQVLEEGPINILGRLMFVKKMPPARLEPVAEKLSLNLTHTIVYTCCPKILSRRHHWSDGPGTSSNMSDGTANNMSDGTANNMSDGTASTNVHPEKLVRHILNQLIIAMKSVTNESSAIFDLASAQRLLTLECYADMIHQMRKLQAVDLTLLKSQQENLCFFVNLTNLMMLHCHLSHLTLQLPNEHPELSQQGAADNIAYLGSFSYAVGQMGQVSVLDLLSLICPETLQLSSHMTASRKIVSPGNDPLRKLCPVTDPWLMFVINMGCLSSPPLQVLVPDEVNLEKSLANFLSQTVLISVEQERVVLPQLLQWNQSLLVSQDAARPGPTSLLQWTLPFLPAGAQKQLEQLLKLDNSDNSGSTKPFTIDWIKFDDTFSICLNFTKMTEGVNGVVSRGGQGVSVDVSSQQEPVYNLSPSTLEYVKQDSLLLATLVSLVCSDQLDNIEQHLTDDHFSSSDLLRPNRSSSDMSLVDMRSYRYHRLTSDYPLLQRHLLHYILPLAACDNPQLVDSSEPILKFVTNDISDQVKLCMFSLPDSLQFVRVIQAMANRLVLEHRWLELLNILSTLPRSLVQEHKLLQTLHDYVLASWAVSQLLQPVLATDVGDQLRQFSSPSCQARTVLSLIDQLPLDQSLDLLELLLTSLPSGCHMWHTVASRRQELLIFSKIEETFKKLEPAVVCRFSKWQEIERASKSQPRDILQLLEQAADFDTALAWSRLFAVDLVQIVQERHLKCVLTCEPSDTVTAIQLLDDLLTHSPTQCLAVCQTLLTSLTKPKEIKFVVSFILSYLSHLLPPSEDLRLKQIGAKALMAIPPRLVHEYMHLISCPHLILEQLLMNMKAELAGLIFGQIKCELAQVKDEAMRVKQEDFNLMLATYARLALQVKVVQVNEKCDSESGQSGNSAGDTRRNSVLERNEMCASPTTSLHQECNKFLSNQFIIPPNPPQPDQWMADSSTSVCMACKVERFSMFNRRHHCRRCGRVVCGSCSTRLTLVFDVMSRTCDQCVEQTNLVSEECGVYSQMANPLPNQQSPAVNQLQLCWKLEPDPVYCQLVRQDFYFEQAPSVTLCVSILKQHSSRLEAGLAIIEMCDQLSQLMVPVSPGVPNPEIDYNLIISVMKQLLFHAKLDFNYNIGQCDMYLARLDLLKTMVEANYQDLPTLRELTKPDTVRRLRDKLLADERLSLAMDVSTKCGIDPTGVWSAMGFACLSLGDFLGAREKFGHCLKVLTDRNKSSPSQSRLLTEILELVDTLPSDGITEVQRLVSNPGSICHTHTLLVPGKGDENRAESIPYKECLYYLRNYGSFLDQINFLRQHNYWMKAVQLAADHHCSPEVFLTGLLMPAMSSGQLGRLLEQMLMLDPSLDKWSHYLTATCKYLLREKYFSTLYHVQLFMKDYIRAAMTCISHFYQRDARSYLDLSERLQFLLVAQQHLQAYLDPGQWGSVPHPLTPVTPPAAKRDKPTSEAARMTLTPEQVNKHIRTVALQIEVTKYLTQAGAAPSATAPTLFAQTSARMELVAMVLLCSDFKVSFDLATRIVKECRLNPALTFTHCSRELAKVGRLDDVTQLTKALTSAGLVDDAGIDEIVGASLLVIADTPALDQSDTLIQLLTCENNKINAFILCGKLRSAYLLAVKRDRVEDVQRIAGAAQRLGQTAVKNICKKWLEQHKDLGKQL